MAQTTITVGKSRDYSFIPMDQWQQPNPVDPATGKPLWPKSAQWSLGALVAKIPSPGQTADPFAAFALTPSADTFTCNVAALVTGVMLALRCDATLEDGSVVQGAEIIESVGDGPNEAPRIVTLQLQAGPEQ